MREKLFSLMFLFVFFISGVGCSPGGEVPTFLREGNKQPPIPPPSPAVNEELAQQAGLQRIIYHIGPIDLEAHQEAYVMLERPLTMRFQVDEPMWVVGFEPKVIDALGKRLDPDLLHSAMLMNMHEENPLCQGGSAGNPFIVATSLLTDIHLPQGYGYPLLPSDPIESRVVLKNPHDQELQEVFFEVAVIARPMNAFTALKDVEPLLLDFEPCTHTAISIPPNEFVKRKATYTLSKGGDVVLAHGLVQDAAVSVGLTKGKETLPFWEAHAKLDHDRKLEALLNNPFEDLSLVPFSPGDAVTVSVTYDNFSQEWLYDAFSGAMLYLARDE